MFVSEYTPNGNVYALTFVGSNGNKTVYREQCRTILNLRSMRFTVNGAEGNTYFVNDNATSVTGIQSLFTISGKGEVGQYSGAPADAYVITSGGTAKLQKDPATVTTNQETFTVTGSGWGHNVGMSQWGATAMAEQGFDYQDILQFYYTGVTIE